MTIALIDCASPDRANAQDAVELAKWAYDQGWKGIQLAYVAGMGPHGAGPQPQVGRQAAKVDPPKANHHASDERALLIVEASQRFGVPEQWISAVIEVESRGEAEATSPKGAAGLMQVMPDTYAGLRERYALGGNPYALRDNVMAGAAFLREMYDLYGASGFFAAYNAGPSRYADYLTHGRALPDETRRYVASIGLFLGDDFPRSGHGDSLLGDRPASLHEPISIASDGELLSGRTGQPLAVVDRLALHGLVAKALWRSTAK